MVNGTSVSAARAASCLGDTRLLVGGVLAFNAMCMEALGASDEGLDPYIHDHKPHPGQVKAARQLRRLLDGTRLTRAHAASKRQRLAGGLAQDRYSIRCLPQFLGPALEALDRADEQITIEINAATDNPLIDADGARTLHGGNFLAQYVATTLDALRAQTALLTKLCDAQIALLVAPEYSGGLPASLVGNAGRHVNMGLKGLQIVGNSIMPLVTYYASPLADRFPTHAEQYNQNVNSQSFGSADLSRKQLQLAFKHLALSFLFAIQAVDLRAAECYGSWDARSCLAPKTARVYDAVHQVIGVAISTDRPYLFDDTDRRLGAHTQMLAADLEVGHVMADALNAVLAD
jgi:phenylalanine ammonia-lyase